MTRSIRLVAGSSSPVLRAGYETKMNVEKHESSLSLVSSDGSSILPASTNFIHLTRDDNAVPIKLPFYIASLLQRRTQRHLRRRNRQLRGRQFQTLA